MHIIIFKQGFWLQAGIQCSFLLNFNKKNILLTLLLTVSSTCCVVVLNRSLSHTGHWVKQLVGFQVGEGREAARAPEGGSVGGVSLICLNASPHVIQFILDHIHQ